MHSRGPGLAYARMSVPTRGHLANNQLVRINKVQSVCFRKELTKQRDVHVNNQAKTQYYRLIVRINGHEIRRQKHQPGEQSRENRNENEPGFVEIFRELPNEESHESTTDDQV